MTRKQYNNVIQWTLLNCSSAEEDSLSVCRAVLKNLGMPFPNGSYRDVLRVLMSNEYMGWHSCTLEQAAECADQGIPAVGISTSRVLVLAPDGEEEAVIKEAVNQEARKAFIPSSEELSLDERMEMQFFAYALTANGNINLAGETVYPSPRYIHSADTNGETKIMEVPNGGNVKARLRENTVLIVNNVYPVQAGGIEWINVTYYKIDNESCSSGSGWIDAKYTKSIARSLPGENDVSSGLNRDLRIDQLLMLKNARYIHNYLCKLVAVGERWSNNAMYAVLGNMVQESTVNPNMWYNRETGNLEGAYGLTQWHPPTKYFNWLGLTSDEARKNILNQLSYIRYEVANDIQWVDRLGTGMSFKEFTQSTESVSDLAKYFLYCYEHPGNESSKVTGRQNMAKMMQNWIEEF